MLALAMQWWHGREEKPDAMPLAGQEVLSVILKGFFCKYLDHILFYKKKNMSTISLQCNAQHVESIIQRIIYQLQPITAITIPQILTVTGR